MGLVQSSRLVAICLLIFVVFLALLQDHGVDGRKRGKRERRCSLRINEDGKYSVVCIKAKTKGSKSNRGQRNALSPRSPVKPGQKSKVSSQKILMKKAMEARAARDKRRYRFLVCKDRSTAWVTNSLSNDLGVNCDVRQFLQGFTVQRMLNKMRYKYICCSLP